MKKATNQKLTDQQIQEIKTLKNNGVRISFISKLLHAEGLAISTAYYHLSDNRDAYCNKAKKIRAAQRNVIQNRMSKLIDQGYTTGDMAEDWNIPLKTLNRIYTT